MSRSYPARPLRALLAAIPFLLAAPARASDTLDRSIVVLPIDTSKAGGKVTAADRASLEEMLRDEAIDTLQPLGWKVLSGDNTIQLLQDNGIDPTKCDEGSCQLGVARQMTVSIFVSGVIEYTSEGYYTASFRLNDTKSGDPLASKNLSSPDLRGLREQFHKVSTDFYSRAPALKAAQPQAAATSEGHIGGAQADLELSNQSAIVSFDSTPPGAIVLVDGELKCQATPCRKVLALGMHLVSIQQDGYEAAEAQLVAKKGAILSVTLARVSARVAVETNPPGLLLRIDGHDAGKSPLAAADYHPGPHEFLVDDPCYAREGERTVLKKGEDRTVHITPAPRLAGLDVSAEDAQGNAVEAKVLVDGLEVGTTPGTFKVSACAKKLELRSGDSGDTQSLSLSEGKVQTVRSKLSRQSGQLAVSVSRDARCSVGDKSFSVDAGKIETVQLPVGSATVSCSAGNPDGTKASSSNNVQVGSEGARTHIDLGAEPPPPPGYWSDRTTLRYGLILGTGAAGISNYNSFVAQTGWNWTAQLELNLLEFFIAQAGGNVVSINDSSGNALFVWGGTGALGLRPFQGFIQPWVAFRGSAWGSSAIGTSLEGGVRFCGNNFGMDLSLNYGTSGPVPWEAMISFVYTSSR